MADDMEDLLDPHSDQKSWVTVRCNRDTSNRAQSCGTTKLSIFFASLCVIDLFGVFPIVTLPRSIILCGLYGIPLLLLVITLQIYTAVILGRCWVIAQRLKPEIEIQNRYPYAAIAELTYGKKMSCFVTILLDVTVFGASIPNLLVASQNLHLLGLRITQGTFNFSFCLWLIIIGCLLCPIMWLGSPKNMKALASVSVSICTTVALLTWLSIFDDTNIIDNSNADVNRRSINGSGISTNDYIPFSGLDLTPPPAINLLKAYGIIAFQFDIHPMLLTIQVDMKEKRKIGKAVCYGIFTTCTLSFITTFLAAYRYGNGTTNNLLEILPRSWGLYLIILLVTLQLCLSSAVGNSALFQHLEEILNISRDFSFKRIIMRSLLVGLAVFLGELLPRFDIVMGLIGGTLTGPLIFILPPLFYTKILRLEQEYDEKECRLRRRYHSSEADDESSVDEDAVLRIVQERIRKKHKGYGAILDVFPEVEYKTPSGKKDYWKQTCLIIMNILRSDCLLSMAVIIFGLVATFASTYFNVFDNVNTFNGTWSSCILNITHGMMSNL